MKSQYPGKEITYQESEPLYYLQNYAGIQQISKEKAEIIKLQFKQEVSQKTGEDNLTLDKEEDDSLASFFYTQSFFDED